jgi:hypothetical protein
VNTDTPGETAIADPLAVGDLLGSVVTFYTRDEAAADIMRVANFPDELFSFLQMDALSAYRAIGQYGLDTLVELGCFDGRGLEISRLADAQYRGIDLDRAAIERLNQRIALEGLSARAAGHVADIMRPQEWGARLDGLQPLVHLPFNLLGCFPDPGLLLSHLATLPHGLVQVAVFNNDPATAEVRERYYRACGVKDLNRSTEPDGGLVFHGADGFYSRSYSPESLDALLRQWGISPLQCSYNQLGTCLVGAPDSTAKDFV